MALYKLIFSDGSSTTIGEVTFQWIRDHGAKGPMQIVAIIDEDGNNLFEKDKELMYRLFR